MASRRTAKRAAFAVSLACVLSVVACGGSGKPPAVAAVVDGAQVPSADVEALTARYMQAPTTNLAPSDVPIGDARRLVLGYLIRYALLKQLATKAGVQGPADVLVQDAVAAVSPSELAQEGVTTNDLETALVAGELSKRLAAKQFPHVAVADSELHTLYDSVKAHYENGWTVQARAAFLPTAAAAEQFKQSKVDASNFDSLAKGLGAKVAGSMGTVSNTAVLAPEVLDALSKLKPGVLSAPIAAADGWLFFLIESRQDVPGKTFDEARPELLVQLQDQKRQQLFTKWFDEQVKTATITVDPFYGKWRKEYGSVSP